MGVPDSTRRPLPRPGDPGTPYPPPATGAPGMTAGPSVEPRWPGPDAAPIDAACAVCGAIGPHPAAVSIDNLLAPDETLHFLRCSDCGSLTATGSRHFT